MLNPMLVLGTMNPYTAQKLLLSESQSLNFIILIDEEKYF